MLAASTGAQSGVRTLLKLQQFSMISIRLAAPQQLSRMGEGQGTSWHMDSTGVWAQDSPGDSMTEQFVMHQN